MLSYLLSNEPITSTVSTHATLGQFSNCIHKASNLLAYCNRVCILKLKHVQVPCFPENKTYPGNKT